MYVRVLFKCPVTIKKATISKFDKLIKVMKAAARLSTILYLRDLGTLKTLKALITRRQGGLLKLWALILLRQLLLVTQ